LERSIVIATFIAIAFFGTVRFACADSINEKNTKISDKESGDHNKTTTVNPVEKNNLTIDIGLGYSHQTDGNKTKFNTFTLDLITMYSVTKDLDVFLGLPFVYARRTDTQSSTQSKADIGDLNFGSYYQLIKEDDYYISARPFLIVKSNSGSSPYKATGSQVVSGDGHWSIEGGSDFSKTFNKISVFSQVSYTYFFDQTVNNQRNEHADVFYYHVGASYQLNKNLSVSLRLEDSFLGDSKIDGVVTEDSRSPINLTAYLEYNLSSKMTFTPLATFGLNKVADDFSFSVTYGYKF